MSGEVWRIPTDPITWSGLYSARFSQLHWFSSALLFFFQTKSFLIGESNLFYFFNLRLLLLFNGHKSNLHNILLLDSFKSNNYWPSQLHLLRQILFRIFEDTKGFRKWMTLIISLTSQRIHLLREKVKLKDPSWPTRILGSDPLTVFFSLSEGVYAETLEVLSLSYLFATPSCLQ